MPGECEQAIWCKVRACGGVEEHQISIGRFYAGRMLFPVQSLRKNSEHEASVGRRLQCPWCRLWQWRCKEIDRFGRDFRRLDLKVFAANMNVQDAKRPTLSECETACKGKWWRSRLLRGSMKNSPSQVSVLARKAITSVCFSPRGLGCGDLPPLMQVPFIGVLFPVDLLKRRMLGSLSHQPSECSFSSPLIRESPAISWFGLFAGFFSFEVQVSHLLQDKKRNVDPICV